MINSEIVIKKAIQKGADICGIASVTMFDDAPEGYHPHDIYSNCKSVIVFGSHFPLSTLKAKTNSPYTFVRNILVEKMDLISYSLSDDLEKEGINAIPIPSAEPYDFWDAEQNYGRGILSLKHAGSFAGLGLIGKNTLLINNRYGNMIWLGAVLISVELKPNPIAKYEVCNKKCTLCIDLCPQNALDGITINQKLCREYSLSCTDGGGCIYSCNICRKVCPNYNGIN